MLKNDENIARVSGEWSPDAFAGLTLAEVEKRFILMTLSACLGNRARTALSLGISVRTLRNKLNEYGVPPRWSVRSVPGR